MQNSPDEKERVVSVHNSAELKQAKKEEPDQIEVEGALVKRLINLNRLRKAAGIVVILASLFIIPLKNLFRDSVPNYSGPAPGFKYPLSSGMPTESEVIITIAVFLIGVFILWKPWSDYELVLLSEQPLKGKLLRK